MTILVIIGDIAIFAGGATVGFLFKEKILALVIGANRLSAKLHAEADALLKK